MILIFTHVVQLNPWQVLDSFDLLQHINEATHVLGHTLDLIMSYGFSINKITVEDARFSDHMPVVFNTNQSPWSLFLFSLSIKEMPSQTSISSAAELPLSPDKFPYSIPLANIYIKYNIKYFSEIIS